MVSFIFPICSLKLRALLSDHYKCLDVKTRANCPMIYQLLATSYPTVTFDSLLVLQQNKTKIR